MSTVTVRFLLLGLVVVSAVGAAVLMWTEIGEEGSIWTRSALVACFSLLVLDLAMSCWVYVFGFLRRLVGRDSFGWPRGELPQTAVTVLLVTIRNEDPERVFSALRAMYASLCHLGVGGCFEIFVCSDSDDPAIARRERHEWEVLVHESGAEGRIHYRQRATNSGRKSGNVADFCRRWGARYRYMILLDADSRMSAPTMVEMVRRMEGNSRLGILQAPLLLVDHHSVFARMQQFSARLLGPMQASGVASWQGADGNFWGHNAIVRVDAFASHCGLPELPGPPPFGGVVLSHDFVEAALMRRGGWEIRLADDLEGSYEEAPPSLGDYAQRERRWCCGNLQHLPLIFARGLRPLSRVHLAMGVMHYLAAPLWLLFLVLGTALAVGNSASVRGPGAAEFAALPGAAEFAALPGAAEFAALPVLLGLVLTFLFLPRLLGFLLVARREDERLGFGGGGRLALSVFLETAVTAVLAPLMMLYHCSHILGAARQTGGRWCRQSRSDRNLSVAEAWRHHRKHTLLAGSVLLALAVVDPSVLPWLLPVLIGPFVAPMLAVVLANVSLGRALRNWDLLLIPEERNRPAALGLAGVPVRPGTGELSRLSPRSKIYPDSCATVARKTRHGSCEAPVP